MNDRKPLMLGAGFLVLVVAGVGAGWAFSQGTGATAPAATAGSAGLVGGFGSVAEGLAREPIPLDRAEPIPMTVYLTPTCECCSDWVGHVAGHGFEVERVYQDDLSQVKRELGLWPQLASCHTAVVNGYVVEGHVPGDVVRRLLAEAPPVRGLAVPGMPIGSPGMEYGDVIEPYDVLAFTSDGQTRVYSEHGRR